MKNNTLTRVIVLVNIVLLVGFYLFTQFITVPASVLIITAHVILLANYGILTYLTSQGLQKNDQARHNIGYLSKFLLTHGRTGVFLVVIGVVYMFIVAFEWNPEKVIDLSLLSSAGGFQVLMQATLVLSIPIWGLLFLARGENARKQLYELVYERISQIFQEEPSAFPDFLKRLYSRWQYQQLLGRHSSNLGTGGKQVLPHDVTLDETSTSLSTEHQTHLKNELAAPSSDSVTTGVAPESNDKNLEYYVEQFQDFLRQYIPSLWECYSHGNLRLNPNDLFIHFVERVFSDPRWIPYLKA